MKLLLAISLFLLQATATQAGLQFQPVNNFRIKAFHIDLRIQVMKLPALMELAHHLHDEGINTIIMEWEASYPYSNESIISNELAYTRAEVKIFIDYCTRLGIDVIPLQQTFGHVEYILRHYKYAGLREDPKDFSQVCPSELPKDSALFRALIKDMISLHQSPYVHIGGDETFLLGHCPKCQKKVAEEGLSKLYFDYIKMICDVVVGLGKKPVLWADIALKYPEYIQLLPKETVFVDWNYGWSLDRFGDHKKLLASGYEVWGAAAIRSDPDNFYLEKWKKHFDNISTFIPETREMHYAGIVMTSWSTSGAYSTVFDAHEDPLLLYPVRRVYPLSGFNLLIDAYTTAIKNDSPLDAHQFIISYCKDHYGLGQSGADTFESALFMAPYPVIAGQVKEKENFSLSQLVDSARQSLRWFQTLTPSKNSKEFAHYILMAEIRLFYLQVLQIEAEMNTDEYTVASHEKFEARLKLLKNKSLYLNQNFSDLNKDFLYASEISKENDQRNYKLNELLGKASLHP
jgi:hexosaminidase